MLLFLKSTAQCDIRRTQVQAVLLAAWHLPRLLLSIDQALCLLWWQVSPEMKAKYRKEKQTNFSALLSILTMSISLALSTNHGRTRSARPASQARVSGVIATSQNRNMRSTCTDVPIFLAQKNTKNVTKRHGFYFYLLYADTVPLIYIHHAVPMNLLAPWIELWSV